MRLYLFTLLFTQIAISQNNLDKSIEAEQLADKAIDALAEKKYALAKELYNKVIEINSNDKNIWFNLAIAELNLGENNSACEHLYKAYTLNDSEAAKLIMKYCPDFRNGTIKSINDVEVMPKFTYEGKEFPLFEKNNNFYTLNPAYTKILAKEFKASKIAKEKIFGKVPRVIIEMTVNRYNVFDTKINIMGGKKEDEEIIKKEIQSILRYSVTYTSAKHKGVSVDLWEKFALPLSFKVKEFRALEIDPTMKQFRGF